MTNSKTISWSIKASVVRISLWLERRSEDAVNFSGVLNNFFHIRRQSDIKFMSLETHFLSDFNPDDATGKLRHPPSLAINAYITKTCLYNFDPLKPQCYIVKLRFFSSSSGLGRAAVCDCGTPWTFLLPFFTGVIHYLHYLCYFCSKKHRLWVLVRTALARRF